MEPRKGFLLQSIHEIMFFGHYVHTIKNIKKNPKSNQDEKRTKNFNRRRKIPKNKKERKQKNGEDTKKNEKD